VVRAAAARRGVALALKCGGVLAQQGLRQALEILDPRSPELTLTLPQERGRQAATSLADRALEVAQVGQQRVRGLLSAQRELQARVLERSTHGLSAGACRCSATRLRSRGPFPVAAEWQARASAGRPPHVVRLGPAPDAWLGSAATLRPRPAAINRNTFSATTEDVGCNQLTSISGQGNRHSSGGIVTCRAECGCPAGF
jgi:hypothetical protein